MPSLTSKGSLHLRDPLPTLVVDLTHQGRPEPRLRQLEPLRGNRTEPNQPLIEVEKDPPQTRAEHLPPPARVGSHPPQAQVERHPPPARAVNQPPQAEARNQPPPEREGVGDGVWANWYQRTLRRAEGGTSEPQGPPYPIGMVQARQEAVSQIYNHVDGKDPPPCNIASETLRAYYSGVDPQTLKTWACQILCMISEYHMAYMTRGSPVTSPILPGEIEDRLLPLTD